MEFHNYIDHRRAIKEQYGVYYENYPYAFFLLDYIVQLKVHKQFDGHWVSGDWDLFRYTDSILKRDLATRLYCFYVRFASFIFKPFRKGFTLHTCIDDQKFPGLNRIIKVVAKQNNWNLCLQPTRDTKIWDLLTLKSISPYRCFLSNKTKYLFSKFATNDEEDWFGLIKDKSFMRLFNRSVESDVASTSRLVMRLGINLFINTGDSSGNARVLIESARIFKSKTVSIAHGYFAEEALLGVAPVRSDKLILWTQKQVTDMSRVLTIEEVPKLAYVGFPKDFGDKSVEYDQDMVLILMGRVEGIIKDRLLRSTFLKVIGEIKKVSSKVVLRLHPNERRGVPIIDEFVAEANIKVSEMDLKSDIAAAGYIIGANTSTLVEAAASGRKVYEIEELAVPILKFEGTVKVKTDEIYSIDRVFDGARSDQRFGFDENQIGKKLTTLFLSLKND